MARTSRYSSTQRQDAVARAFGGDATPADVARELGVHPATLYRWAGEDVAAEGKAPDRTDLRLLRAAQELLRDHDYGEITVEDVARAAGVALRTAFDHFDTKSDLFHAAIDHASNALIDEMTRRAEEAQWPAEPLEQVRLFLRGAAEAAYATPEAHVLFRDLGVPPADSFAQRWHKRFEDALAKLLAEASAAGALDPAVDPADAARVIARAVRGIHASVFEGADPTQAIRLVDRLHLLVAPR